MTKRIAVVGAGPSGLAAIKELLAEGHTPVCFEKADDLGGVFRFSETDGVVWESCRLTSSGLVTAFSDFPVAAHQSDHLRIHEYTEYLNAYCDAFDLKRHIRFRTPVQSIRASEGSWLVRTSAGEERFDAVAVCSGLHQHPHVPRFPGQESFTGEIMHGAQYRRPAQFSGKRVLVVGAGESGADVAAEAALHASEAVLSLRRGVAVLPRAMFGRPKDLLASRLLNSTAHWVFQTRNPADDDKRRVYKWTFLPLLFVDKALQIAFRFFWEFLPLLRGNSWEQVRVNLRTRTLSNRLLADSGGTLNEQFGTKTDDFVQRMAEGKCKQAPAIARFDGPRVIFTDGSECTPDLVVCCTGFDTRTPFLDPQIIGTPRYLHTFHPGLGASLGFIGFLRPAFGAIPPLAELQARWFALLQSGRVALPAETEMLKTIEEWRQFRAHFFRAVRGRLDHLVEFTPFCDALAQQIGCKPKWSDIKKESPRFQKRFLEGAFVAAQYRLVGPHAKPEIARQVIENLPLMHPWPDRWNLHLRWALSRLLHRLKGPAYAPKLELKQ